jgi:hypothetical protein
MDTIKDQPDEESPDSHQDNILKRIRGHYKELKVVSSAITNR